MEYLTYEHKEGVLDCLLQLCRIPSFLTDLYVNFDCSLYCRDTFDAVIKYLAYHAYPEERGLFTTNLIALDALLAAVHEIASRSVSTTEDGLETPAMEKNKQLKALMIEGWSSI